MNTRLRVALVMLIFLLMFSCNKKDSDIQGGNNRFTFNGSTYKITGGEYGVGGNDVVIFLYSEGKANVVYLDLLNTSAIPEGTFTYGKTGANNIRFDYSSTDIDEDNYKFSGGTVSISKSGDIYNLSFDIQTEAGPLKGYYKGKLPQQ